MLPFDLVFSDLARREAVAVHPLDEHARPIGTLLFREFYCNDPGCDCRRVVLHAIWVEKRRVVAGIGYGFEPAGPPFDDEPQIMLDPLNPQSDLSEHVLALCEELIEREPGVRERFIRHYEQWKQVVDDPRHPDHAKVRGENHADPAFVPAYRPTDAVPRNQRCPCRSGKKYKNCCGRAASAPTDRP